MSTPSNPDADATLDARVVAALTAAQDAEPVPAALAHRIKRRVLARIAEAETRHVTVQHADDSWQPFHEGVQIKVLTESEDGVMSYLLRLAPGAVVAAHRHRVDEECVVLEGTLHIGAHLTVPAGGFHMARKDALHAPITTVTGATIFLRGASPHPADLV